MHRAIVSAFLFLAVGCSDSEPLSSAFGSTAPSVPAGSAPATTVSLDAALVTSGSPWAAPAIPARDKFTMTGVLDGTTERCADPPCCLNQCPNQPPPKAFHCTGCCQLQDPPERVDLAFFVVSLHHGPDGPPPNDEEVKRAARSFHRIWPKRPDKLVILMPAGPMISSSTIPRTEVFKNELSRLYSYQFNYAVTGTPFCNLGALTQGIITGGQWPIQENGCVTHHYPPEASAGAGYDTYGDFLVKSATEEVSFHVLAAQTPGGGVNAKLVSQLLFLSDAGKVPRGTEPTFVAGDFNWPADRVEQIDTTLGWTLESRGNWLNCNHACKKPAGSSVFVPGKDTPAKLQLFQLNGPTRLVPVGIQQDSAGSAHLHLDSLSHNHVGVLFSIAAGPTNVEKTCKPPPSDPRR